MAIPAEKINVEKVAEKPVEKRRALGRGLESLLPSGPRVVPTNDPALAQSARTDEAPADDLAAAVSQRMPVGTREVRGQGAPLTSSGQALTKAGADAGAAVALGGEGEPGSGIELHAVARRTVDGQPALELALDAIDSNPHQTRMDFDQEFLQELARSIQVQGVIQPIVVRPGEGGRYILILGERRLRASRVAGKATIPAIVKRVSEQQAAEMTIVENLQRQDLDCLEQAEAFANLSTEFGLTQEEIGKRVGASRETVSNYLRLLKLPAEVQNYLRRGDLTYSHARELLGLHDESQIVKLAHMTVKKKMSVILLEEAVLDLNVPMQRPEGASTGGARWVDPNVRAAQRTLETILGMRVRIRDRKGKGKITIEYGTLEDFDRVVGMLKGK
ncbi:MAG: ParB/RepB/Spo0J family partition protein [Terriglobales bacterium]